MQSPSWLEEMEYRSRSNVSLACISGVSCCYRVGCEIEALIHSMQENTLQDEARENRGTDGPRARASAGTQQLGLADGSFSFQVPTVLQHSAATRELWVGARVAHLVR